MVADPTTQYIHTIQLEEEEANPDLPAEPRIPMTSGRLNNRMSSFLADQDFSIPHLVVDLDRVEENYRALDKALPQADIFYAVKANPHEEVIKRLASLGSCFDTASLNEIDLCLNLGISPDRVSFGNTIKKVRDITAAYKKGIRLYAFDSDEELGKLAEHAPGSDVFCRVLVNCDGAEWPLSKKFGCSTEMAYGLIVKAKEAGLNPVGFSFHVGSQQTNLDQWDSALSQVEKLFNDLARVGIKLTLVNMGGGFPAHYTTDIPDAQAYGQAITKAMDGHFGNSKLRMIVEPGRYIVGDAGVIEAEVVLVSRKEDKDKKRWVYLDIGLFSGLAECIGEAIRYPISVPGKEHSTETGPVVLAGPSCDSLDILYQNTAYMMPMDLKAGDKVLLHSTGAYTTTYSSVGFNGFPPLACVCI